MSTLRVAAFVAALMTAAGSAMADPVPLTDAQMDKVTAGAFTSTFFGNILTSSVTQTGPSSGYATATCGSGGCGVLVTSSSSSSNN